MKDNQPLNISRNPSINFDNDAIQFPRLIAELEAAGAFTDKMMDALAVEMDLSWDEISQIIDRAQHKFEEIKKLT